MRKTSARGFTLLEFLVTTSVSAIALTIGVPSYQSTIAGSRLVSQANTLVSSLTLARSEAVKRGKSVSVCRADNTGTACATSSGDWQNGWLVVSDDGATIRELPQLSGNNQLSPGSFGKAVAFDAMGMPDASGSFVLCDHSRDGYGREVEINAIGRFRVVRHDGTAQQCS